MSDIYGELTRLLVPDVIPRVQGQTFKCKEVKRKYAFEHGTVPREETSYMKIVYSAKHGLPSASVCNKGGETFEKIFGYSCSPLELFLLKRKILGPCWLKIKNPRLNPEVVSWCRLEVAIENPKFVERCSQQDLPPPLVSLSVGIKTVVNPATHIHEIVALSGLVHTKVETEVETVLNPQVMKRFTFIRKLGLSCGTSFPAEFPHDIKTEVSKNGGGIVQIVENERALISLFLTKLQVEDPDVFVSHNLLGFLFYFIF
jgi:DNA polymerase alpha subunit A